MPDYLRISDLRMFHSVPSRQLPEPVENFLREPDLSAVEGQPTKYWEISGRAVTLMDAAARDVVDTDEKERQDTAMVDELDNVVVRELLEKINVLETKAGIRNTTFDEIKTDAKAKLG